MNRKSENTNLKYTREIMEFAFISKVLSNVEYCAVTWTRGPL